MQTRDLVVSLVFVVPSVQAIIEFIREEHVVSETCSRKMRIFLAWRGLL